MLSALADFAADGPFNVIQRDEVDEYKGPMLKAWANRHNDNIRGLLGTLHEVLWPDSGWVPVQVTDLIEPKRVKMSFRKAMLKVHPDKVKVGGQGQGASVTVEHKLLCQHIFIKLTDAHSNAMG